MREQRGVLSLQVLQEFFAAATRKLGMSGEAAGRDPNAHKRGEGIMVLGPVPFSPPPRTRGRAVARGRSCGVFR